MITEKELRELTDFRGGGKPILSLYLDVDLTRQDKDECKLALKGLLKEVGGKALRKDVERIKRFFDFEYDWQDKGIAIFSCQGRDFWRVHRLSVPVRSEIFVGQRPHIKPLTDLFDEYERHCVALVDREQARLFLVQLGEIEEHTGALAMMPGRHKRGGWAQARYQRHIEDHAQQNLRRAAEAVAEFFEREGCSHLILAGTEETLAQFRELLPKPLQEHIIGEFAMEMTAPTDQILAKAMEIKERTERQREAELVERLITSMSKGRQAAIGLDDTLFALQEGRVHTLVVAEGFKAKGYVCLNCGYITAQDLGKCFLCGGETQEIDDVVNRAIQMVIEAGGEVEVVKGSEALKRAGNIGAILRY